MKLMFTGITELRALTLGESLKFNGNPGLPGVSVVEFTGRWQNVGDGTVANPTGELVFTSTQLTSNFDGQVMADTFVWQPR
jgi:hypothetical protein